MSMSQAERDAQDAITAQEKPMKDWQREIAETDGGINARVIEEIFNAMDAPAKARVSQETRDKFAAREEIRGRKPGV